MGCRSSKPSREATPRASQEGSSGPPGAQSKAIARPSLQEITDTMTQMRYDAKRRVVFAEPADGPSISALAVTACPSIPKSDAVKHLLQKALQVHFLFGVSLAPEQINLMVDAMNSQDVAVADELITQGDVGQFFYIVERGQFSISVDGQVVDSNVGAGRAFGELALLYNSPRAATVTATKTSRVWAINRQTFHAVLAHDTGDSDHAAEVVTTLAKVPLLRDLTADQIKVVAGTFSSRRFRDGETIVQKGEVGSTFYIVQRGSVICRDLGGDRTRQPDVRLGVGDYFGERALLTDEACAATVVASGDVGVLSLHRTELEQLVGPLSRVLERNISMRALEAAPFLAHLGEQQRKQMCRMCREQSFAPGTSIIDQGQPGQAFYIVIEGVLSVRVTQGSGDSANDYEVAVLESGDHFGEMSLMDNTVASASVVATNSVKCFVLGGESFLRFLSGDVDLGEESDSVSAPSTSAQQAAAYLKEDAQARRKQLARAQTNGNLTPRQASPQETRRSLKVSGITLRDLDVKSVLGVGTFGVVKLVQHKRTKNYYALKCLQKAHLIAAKQTKCIVIEKTVMQCLDHPFIAKLYATYKDEARLYMLLELILGGELFVLLHRSQRAKQKVEHINEPHARFYAGQVLLALEHMHGRSVIYRDLKPENLLIDEHGYIKIIDFGFAKQTQDRAFTLCGTPEYLSPEQVAGKGHTKAVDYWALGILIFEMLQGFSPFAKEVGLSQLTIFRNIMNSKVEFDKTLVSNKRCMDLMRKLLTKTPAKRLGSFAGGAGDVKSHRWFKDYEWGRIVKRDVPAPWIPTIENPCDTQNFEKVTHDEQQFNPYLLAQDDGAWYKDF